MAAVEDRTCEQCGERHVLCFPGAHMLEADRDYEYDCPKNQQRVRFTASATFGRSAPTCPPGSVKLRLVP